jgi:hypothetical protein
MPVLCAKTETIDLVGHRCEAQMQTHEQYYGSAISAFKQHQHRLIDIIDKTNADTDLDVFKTDFLPFPFLNGHWPNDVAPFPQAHIRLSQLYHVRGDHMASLKHGIQGYLSLERRTGDKWVRHAFEYVHTISRALGLVTEGSPWGKNGLPTELQMWILKYVYMYNLAISAREALGADSGYARAIQAWYDGCVKDECAPREMSFHYVPEAERAQKMLLAWAGLSEDRGIGLT